MTDEAAIEAVANLLGFKADIHTLCVGALLRVVNDPLTVPKAPHRKLRGVRMVPIWPFPTHERIAHPCCRHDGFAEWRMKNPSAWADKVEHYPSYRVDARGPAERELNRYLVRACTVAGVTREDLQAR